MLNISFVVFGVWYLVIGVLKLFLFYVGVYCFYCGYNLVYFCKFYGIVFDFFWDKCKILRGKRGVLCDFRK